MAAPDYIPEEALEDYNFFEAMGDTAALKELEDLYKPAEVPSAIPQIQAPEPFVDPLEEAIKLEQQAEAQRDVQQQQALEDVATKYEDILLAPTSEFYQQTLQDSVIDPSMREAIERIDKNVLQGLDREKTKLFRALVEQNIRKGQDIITAQQNASASLIGITRAERTMQAFQAPPIKAGEGFSAEKALEDPTPFGGFARQEIQTQQQAEEKAKRQRQADAEKSKMYRNFATQAVQELRSSGEDYTNQDVIDRAKELERNFAGSIFGNFYELARQSLISDRGLTIEEFNALPVTSEEKKTVKEVATFYHDEFVNNLYPEYSGDEAVMAAAGLSIDEETGNIVPTPPTFLGEVMMDRGDQGQIMETRTAQAMRGIAGLVRPVTLTLSNMMTYDVYKDPETGKLIQAEEAGFLQQPLMTTKERAEQPFTETLQQDIAATRTLADDFMDMPRLTAGLSEEGAGILGMGIDVMLPVTPVGLVAPAAKGISKLPAAAKFGLGKAGTKLRGKATDAMVAEREALETELNTLRTRETGLVDEISDVQRRINEAPEGDEIIDALTREAQDLDAELKVVEEEINSVKETQKGIDTGQVDDAGETYRKYARFAENTGVATERYLQVPLEEFGKFMESAGANTVQLFRNRKVNKILRETQFDISDVDAASIKLADEINKVKPEAMSGDLVQQAILKDLEDALKYLEDFRGSGAKRLSYIDGQAIPTEALIRLMQGKPQQVQAIANDIIQSRRLVQDAVANGTRNIDPATSFGIRFWNKVVETAAVNRIYSSNADDIIRAFAESNGKITDDVIDLTDLAMKDRNFKANLDFGMTKEYLDDYLFNFLPENFVFISPKAAVSVPAFQKFGKQVTDDMADFWKGTLTEGTNNKIIYTPKNTDDVTKLFEELQRNYGGAAPKVIQDLKDKLGNYLRSDVPTAIELSQLEMNLLHTVMKENMFEALIRGGDTGMIVKPRRATREAIERADVPLPRRNEIMRSVREFARRFSGKIDPKLDYSKASQYGLTRMLQTTEQELSMLPQRMEKYVSESLESVDGDVPLAFDKMLKEQAVNLGLKDDFEILHALMKQTFDMGGVSDEILDSFIRVRMVDGQDLVTQYNRLYDDFIATKGGKEVDTLGGKFFEKKFTVIPMTILISDGLKSSITKQITADMEILYPELFYRRFKSPEEIKIAKEQRLAEATQVAETRRLKLEKLVKEYEQTVEQIKIKAEEDVTLAKAEAEAVETEEKARIAQARIRNARKFEEQKDALPDDLIKETQEQLFDLPNQQARRIQDITDALGEATVKLNEEIKSLRTNKAARIRESVKDIQDQIDTFPQGTQDAIAAETARLQSELKYYESGGMTTAASNIRTKLSTVNKDVTDARKAKFEELKTQRADAAAAEKATIESEIEDLIAEKTKLRAESVTNKQAVREDIQAQRDVLDDLLQQNIADARARIDAAKAARDLEIERITTVKEQGLLAQQAGRDIRKMMSDPDEAVQSLSQALAAKYPNKFGVQGMPVMMQGVPTRTIDEAVAAVVYTTLKTDLEDALTATQVQRINKLLSDLYEGSDVIGFDRSVKYGAPTFQGGVLTTPAQIVGQYTMEAGSGLFLSQAVRSVLNKGNLSRVKQALKAVPDADLVKMVQGIEIPPDALRFAQISDPQDILYAKIIVASIKNNSLQNMESIFGFNATGIISALENIGFPPVKTSYTADGLRPLLVEFDGKGIMALPQDIQVLNSLKQQSIEGTLGQTLDVLSRKSESAAQYALSSIYYMLQGSIQSAKGGMLGGTFAPTGKYVTVNAATAPLIQMYTTPSMTTKSLLRFMAASGGGLAVDALAGTPFLFTSLGMLAGGPLNKLLAALAKTTEKAGTKTSASIFGVAGASVGGIAAGPVGAGVGGVVGGVSGLAIAHLLPVVEDVLIKARGTEYIGKYLPLMDPTKVAITTIDGRIITAGSLQEMIQRNNILFGQVDFEFSRRSLEGILRQAETTSTGQKASAWRQAFRWLRPDRPNFWNTLAMETDNAFRIQVFTDSLALGYTEKQAAEFARRTLLDYSDITEFEKRYIAQYFLFYSFMRQSFFEVAGSVGRRDLRSARNIAAAVRFGIDQKKIANTDELFNDISQKEKALAATWTKMGKSYDQTMTLHYGPAFPSTESFIQLANAMSFAFLDMPSLTGYKPEQSTYNTVVENMILKGNPYTKVVFNSLSKKFRSENAPHGLVPVRMVLAMKASGTFEHARLYFDLEPVPPEEMRLGNPTYPETGQAENVQYRFGSKTGSERFLLLSLGLIGAGLDRGLQDWTSNMAEQLQVDSKDIKLKRYGDGSMALEIIGLSSPIAVPNHIMEQDKVLRQIKKEISAEMD